VWDESVLDQGGGGVFGGTAGVKRGWTRHVEAASKDIDGDRPNKYVDQGKGRWVVAPIAVLHAIQGQVAAFLKQDHFVPSDSSCSSPKIP
jgi:hypothetical protein